MRTQITPEVGDTFKLKLKKPFDEFYFNNIQGGTGDSSGKYSGEKWEGKEAIVKITKVWYDDETGWRCWSVPVNQELIDYMKRQNPNDNRIFVSEHELEIIK